MTIQYINNLNRVIGVVMTEKLISFYSETCLNRTSMRPTFVFGIDKCSVYTGEINKNFLH